MCRPVLSSSWHNLRIPRWILYLPFLTSKAIPLVRESAARDFNVAPSGVFASVKSVTTTFSSIDSGPLATTFPLLTGDGPPISTSYTTLFFIPITSTVIFTTNANGQVVASDEVFTGLPTPLFSIPDATSSPALGPNAQSSPINPGVIAGPIVVTMGMVLWVIWMVLWVILRRRKAVLRAKIPSEDLTASKDRPASAQRHTLQTETDLRAHHASWEPYLDLTFQPSDITLTPSSTISTRQLYISNQ
ncbi:hypothetical protein B0H11DRAFT_1953152, partial [Mycena galericulata]